MRAKVMRALRAALAMGQTMGLGGIAWVRGSSPLTVALYATALILTLLVLFASILSLVRAHDAKAASYRCSLASRDEARELALTREWSSVCESRLVYAQQQAQACASKDAGPEIIPPPASTKPGKRRASAKPSKSPSQSEGYRGPRPW